MFHLTSKQIGWKISRRFDVQIFQQIFQVFDWLSVFSLSILDGRYVQHRVVYTRGLLICSQRAVKKTMSSSAYFLHHNLLPVWSRQTFWFPLFLVFPSVRMVFSLKTSCCHLCVNGKSSMKKKNPILTNLFARPSQHLWCLSVKTDFCASCYL